jgi:GntR family uxuAB operon transcriptional repressor
MTGQQSAEAADAPGSPAALPARAAAPPARAGKHADRGLALAEMIVTHALRTGLGPGGRLPTERQLAEDLGVTRSSVRYALAIMEAQGHISREVGRGTYLRSASTRPAGTLADGQAAVDTAFAATGGPAQPRTSEAAFAPADVMMTRRLLEPPAMPLAVAWATAADFEEMDRCLAGGDRAASYEEFEAWDLALHRSIIAATHSPLLVTLYASIEAARHGHIWGDLKRRSASAERRRCYQADHHDIVLALKARDSATAVKAMRAHLARVSDHLNATDPAAGIWH